MMYQTISADNTSHQYQVVSTPIARAIIAHHILGAPSTPLQIGEIHLYAHQIEALTRIRAAINEFRGALLCDTVGLGKTFVALAVAQTYTKPLIVVPAVLHTMWQEAFARTKGVQHRPHIISFEALSRSPTLLSPNNHDFVIIDEAHHARNRTTKRYAALARICQEANVLLMSATPIHNSRADLTTLIALFLGSHAHSLTEQEISRLLIRRTQLRNGQSTDSHTQHASWVTQHPTPSSISSHTIPVIIPTRWIRISLPLDSLSPLLNLPPPIPPRDAGAANHFVTLSLIRQWISSDAALQSALRRRITRTSALLDALLAGRHPTTQELRAWIYADNTIQLAFPELLTTETIDATHTPRSTLVSSIRAHLHALIQLTQNLATPLRSDQSRAEHIRHIRRQHPREKIIAFSQYADTVTILFRFLRNDGHVAALTSHGGRIATGPIARQEILTHFAPLAHNVRPPGRHNDITLLLTTDLLSEGVNLQDASVVIHLDLPWTAAALNQRVGRAARLGSPHPYVTVYGFRAPQCIENQLRATTIIWRKARLAHTTLSPADTTEAIRTHLRTWLNAHQADVPSDDTLLVATIPSTHHGLLAACTIDGAKALLTTDANGQTTSALTEVHNTILRATQSYETPSYLHSDTNPPFPPTPPSSLRQHLTIALTTLYDWYQTHRALTDAGLTHDLSHTSSTSKRLALRNLGTHLASTPWHLRPTTSTLTSQARHILAAPLSLAQERSLTTASHTPSSIATWLQTHTHPLHPHPPSQPTFHIAAILLFIPVR